MDHGSEMIVAVRETAMAAASELSPARIAFLLKDRRRSGTSCCRASGSKREVRTGLSTASPTTSATES